jgi:hypothetical protein
LGLLTPLVEEEVPTPVDGDEKRGKGEGSKGRLIK